jgi:hypothetical protein
MKKFSSLLISSLLALGMALSQCAVPSPAFASGDNVVQNNHGVYVQSAASSIYTPVSVNYTTDGQGKFIPAGKVPGGYGVQPVRLNTASTNITSSAYVQLLASTPTFSSWIDVYNGTSQELILATGSSGSPVQFLDIPAGVSKSMNLYLPAGTRLSVTSAASTASSGAVILNFIQ